jgi:hypothetical protein
VKGIDEGGSINIELKQHQHDIGDNVKKNINKMDKERKENNKIIDNEQLEVKREILDKEIKRMRYINTLIHEISNLDKMKYFGLRDNLKHPYIKTSCFIKNISEAFPQSFKSNHPTFKSSNI